MSPPASPPHSSTSRRCPSCPCRGALAHHGRRTQGCGRERDPDEHPARADRPPPGVAPPAAVPAVLDREAPRRWPRGLGGVARGRVHAGVRLGADLPGRLPALREGGLRQGAARLRGALPGGGGEAEEARRLGPRPEAEVVRRRRVGGPGLRARRVAAAVAALDSLGPRGRLAGAGRDRRRAHPGPGHRLADLRRGARLLPRPVGPGGRLPVCRPGGRARRRVRGAHRRRDAGPPGRTRRHDPHPPRRWRPAGRVDLAGPRRRLDRLAPAAGRAAR